jgi:deoxycytidylate deaminase
MCVYSEPEQITKKSQCKFLERAAKIARKSNMYRQHGAVIVVGDQIVAEGYNYDYIRLCHKYSIHAEVHVINKARKSRIDLTEADLYVVRIGRPSMDYPLRYSKPCESCTEYIKKMGIRKVYYSLDEM